MGSFQIEWPSGWEGVDISVKELVPVIVAAALWGGLWQGHHIHFHSDNMAVLSIMNTKTSKAPQLMHLLRCFSFYCAFYCFHVSCMHVPGGHRGMRPVLDLVSYGLSEDVVLHTKTSKPSGVSSQMMPNVQQIVAVWSHLLDAGQALSRRGEWPS